MREADSNGFQSEFAGLLLMFIGNIPERGPWVLARPVGWDRQQAFALGPARAWRLKVGRTMIVHFPARSGDGR